MADRSPNHLAQDFAATGPDQKWAADISYIWTAEGWLYLAIVLDLFSRRIVGWVVRDRLKKISRFAPCSGRSSCASRGLVLHHHPY
jgi:transposase InsO family protein